MEKILISIIIPVYNEEENVFRVYYAVTEETKKYQDIDFEIIFTDNHSTDKTFEHLRQLAEQDVSVKVLRFTRNFGFNRSILTGYRHARGNAAIQIDCDLEDPPSLIHEFIRLYQRGHDVVVGVREQRTENKFMAYARKCFYKLLNKISETPHLTDGGDFRLVDRSILDQLKIIEDAQPYVRGLISELARNQCSVTFSRNLRQFGKSKFPLRQLIKLGMDGIYAHSIVPLRIATFMGIGIAFLTVLITGGYILGWLLSSGSWPAGFATTIVLILFGISLNAIFLGIIGEYIARIYQQVRVRPTVIIEKSLNIEVSGAIYKQ
jgi:glycosyltransferase involved in cell wall biosynthesis